MTGSSNGTSLRVALLSFPKSGRTWLKLMLKFYLERACGIADLPLDEDRCWHRFDSRIPKLVIEHDDDPHFKLANELAPGRERFADHRVILLVRDPRDIMVSLYFEMTKRTRFYEDWGFETTRVRQDTGDLSSFIRGPVGRLETLIAYWRIWDLQRSAVERFLLLRYEDMHLDAMNALRRTLEIMGIEPDTWTLAYAVEQCRFDRMRHYEEQQRFGSKTLQPGDYSDPDSYKVRRGKIGGYRDYLSAADLEYIDCCCERLPAMLSSYGARR